MLAVLRERGDILRVSQKPLAGRTRVVHIHLDTNQVLHVRVAMITTLVSRRFVNAASRYTCVGPSDALQRRTVFALTGLFFTLDVVTARPAAVPRHAAPTTASQFAVDALHLSAGTPKPIVVATLLKLTEVSTEGELLPRHCDATLVILEKFDRHVYSHFSWSALQPRSRTGRVPLSDRCPRWGRPLPTDMAMG
ncbi:hypothetical protein MCHLDSM_03017 [Mycolicibacterium chlorophenolicum]|uniref:Uncharacterized protein n=1 Tax=Mycolicibacterium chlorophenolicum TaxID=37916 RepID=A0A0J6W4Z6_9MYCO|nr:hypothetical protein MCHLDSM_03017 [Mycolicibacterium chlorophenolicum]